MTPAELDELRASLGTSQELVDAYDPVKAVYKVGRKWSYQCLDGQDHQGQWETKREAISMAGQHWAMKRDQLRHPESYTDLVRVRAREVIRRAEELRAHRYISETEAYRIAHQEQNERIAKLV
jgi:hypothetical protein